MTTCLALLRGLNIGGHNRLPMKELVSTLTGLGCKNISTYIQSGNAIFDTGRNNREKLSRDITQAIRQRYGFAPGVILLSGAELHDVIARNPFPTEDGKLLHFLFIFGEISEPDLECLNTLKTDREEFFLTERVFYLYAPDGVGGSRLVRNLERCLGVATTGRNWNTLSRLSEMLNENSGGQSS